MIQFRIPENDVRNRCLSTDLLVMEKIENSNTLTLISAATCTHTVKR